jgi:hypothetical protein
MLVRKIVDVGYKLEFKYESYILKGKEKYLVLVTGKRERNLYKLGISRNVTKDPIIIDLLTIVAFKKWIKVELWHKGLGHVGIQSLKLMHEKSLVHGFNIKIDPLDMNLCHSCL